MTHSTQCHLHHTSLMGDEESFYKWFEKSENSFKLKFTIKSRQCSEKQTNSNNVTGEKVKQKKDLRCTFPWVTAFQSQEETVPRLNRISVLLPKAPLDEPGVWGVREAVCWTAMCDWWMSRLSCSQTERAGHRYCCWAGLEDPSRTATHLGLSALGAAGKQIGNSGVKNRPVQY